MTLRHVLAAVFFVLAVALYIAGTSGWATGLLLVVGLVCEMAAWATLMRRDASDGAGPPASPHP